jgi:hypothetical protein
MDSFDFLRRASPICLILASTLAISLTACGPKGGAGQSYHADAATFAPGAFDPTSIRIHPLTQIDPGAGGGGGADGGKGGCGIAMHVELRDRFGDAVKGLGTLRVQLYKPGGVGGAAGVGNPGTIRPGLETQELSWDVPQLADPEQNSLRYDPVTRTYKIPLVVPAWVCEWAARKNDSKADGKEGDWLKLRAVLTRPGIDGRPVSMDDEFVLQR